MMHTHCGKSNSVEFDGHLHTIQRLMLSKGAKRIIIDHITVIIQYYWDKTIAWSGDMYKDDSVWSLNVSASQTLRYKISLFEFPLLKLYRSVCGK